ncbi:HSPB1-associated protein 1 homolog isoform X1 [Varroa destructor]|uniref:JmjC domain-containing protein n=1 Tax=Varroa destructor TaxID=109461 RepID=A0A7M7KMY8_VARDE|nr:HSPB1-associated protein 1 homolog isoform X1 [Varroa destructor]
MLKSDIEQRRFESRCAKDMSLKSYLTAQKYPVIFPLPNKWPCADFTIDEWGDVLPDLYEFRHESRQKCPHFEVQHIQRFKATIKDFAGAIRTGYFNKPSIDLHERWVYSAYNWMSAGTMKRKDCLDWSFFESGDKDCTHTTIWMGSKGAFTPCHRDSYGLNLSCQLIGAKEWFLFPPSDGKYLYETRLPFEESTVFSSIDFNRMPINIAKWPLFKNATPYRVIVKPGEVLLIPKHWWHFVRCVDDGNINVNRWFDLDSDAADKIDEAIASLLVDRIHDLVEGKLPAFNGVRPVRSVKVIFEAIKRSLEKMNCDSDTAEHSCTQPSEEPIRHDSLDEADSTPSISEPNDEEIVRRYLISPVERCSLEEFIKATPKHESTSKTRVDFSTNDIFRAVLDSEVLALIRKKLSDRYCRQNKQFEDRPKGSNMKIQMYSRDPL